MLAAAVGDVREEAVDALQALSQAVTADEGAHLQVFVDGEGGEDVVDLGDVGHAGLDHAVRREVGYVAPQQLDAPAADGEEAKDGLEEGGLAGAVGADDGHDLGLVEDEGDAVEDLHFPVAGDHAFSLEHGRHRYCPPR